MRSNGVPTGMKYSADGGDTWHDITTHWVAVDSGSPLDATQAVQFGVAQAAMGRALERLREGLLGEDVALRSLGVPFVFPVRPLSDWPSLQNLAEPKGTVGPGWKTDLWQRDGRHRLCRAINHEQAVLRRARGRHWQRSWLRLQRLEEVQRCLIG